MRTISTILSLAMLISCGKKQEMIEEKITVDTVTKDSVVAKDSLKTPMAGTDSDSHGCKTSAGFTWSELKQKCIRVFEEGTKLSSYDSDKTAAEFAAYVIFESNGNKAELFLPNEKPLILERKSEGDQYVNGDWQLVPWKGYVLKKGNDILYIGQ